MKNYCGYCGKEIFEVIQISGFNGHRTFTYFDDKQYTCPTHFRRGREHNCKEKINRDKEKEFKIWSRTDKENCSIIYW